MNPVKLSIAPFVLMRLIDAVLFKKRSQSRLLRQFLCVQTLPDPNAVLDRIAVCAIMWRLHGLPVVDGLVLIIVTTPAGLQRIIQRAETCAMMFFVTGNTGNTRRPVFGNHCRMKGLRVMTGFAIGIHLLPVADIDTDRVTRGAGVSAGPGCDYRRNHLTDSGVGI